MSENAAVKRKPTVSLDVPPGFTGLSITGDGRSVAARISELSDKVAEETAGDSASLQQNLGAVAQLLTEKDVRLYGVFTADASEPTPATLLLAVVELEDADTHAAAIRSHRHALATQLVRNYRQRHPAATVDVLELSQGPAMVAQRAGDHHLSPEATGTSGTKLIPELSVEFQIPSPDGAYLVVMVVTTSSEAGWSAVGDAAKSIADSIRWEFPANSSIIDTELTQ